MKFLLLVLPLLFSACSMTQPPVTEYRIYLPDTSLENNNSRCTDESLKVLEAFSSSTLVSKDMSYVEGMSKQYVYSQSQWADYPSTAITSEIIKAIKGSHIFKNVQSAKSRGSSSYILEINIEDFMQYFSEDYKSSYANVELSFSLINTKTTEVVQSEIFSKKIEIQSLDADGGVKGLNLALKGVISDGTKWLSEVCK